MNKTMLCDDFYIIDQIFVKCFNVLRRVDLNNHGRSETGAFLRNWVNIMAADDMASVVAHVSVAIVLTV